MNEKRFRLDFFIAIGALLISTVAALASVYQSRVVAQQFSAAVWPYVSFDVTNSPTSIALDLRNDGLGPAIVRWVSISWKQKPEPSIEAVVDELSRAAHRVPKAHRISARMTTSTPEAGLVIPANGTHPIIHIDGAVIARLRPQLDHFDLAICYCSLTGTCWMQNFKTRSGEPRGVGACPHPAT